MELSHYSPYARLRAPAKKGSEPLGTIAATVTGLLASGRSDFALASGRVLQAALKGKLLQQVGKEIDKLVEKGNLREDYANKPLRLQIPPWLD